MIKELTIEMFTRLVVRKLKTISGREVVLQNPTTASTFPCSVVKTPLVRNRVSDEQCPVYSRFTISIEEWCDTQYTCMSQSRASELTLREMNLKKVSNEAPIYDDITKKYRLISNYEVNYNGLIDSFEIIK